MSREKILVIDDEKDISSLISLYLSKDGYQVIEAHDGRQAISLFFSLEPVLVILDILLPDIDGIQVCQEIRKKSDVPIIFLSCKDEDLDKILCLTIGGDDYITKPFSPGELVARVRAHLRRRNNNLSNQKDKTVLTFPSLTIDLTGHSVLVNKIPITLSAKEYQLLVLLAKNPNKVFSSSELYHIIWGSPSLGDNRTVMVHMSNLRKKIKPNSIGPFYIQTIKGAGYKFNYSE